MPGVAARSFCLRPAAIAACVAACCLVSTGFAAGLAPIAGQWPDGSSGHAHQWAQATPGKADSSKANADQPPGQSALDAPLFYQLLIGEIELRSGRAGNAYEVMLDAAKRQSEESLFQRAVDIALQARDADKALVAVAAWRKAKPSSLAPLRYEVQIQLALGRADGVTEPLAHWLKLLPAPERAGLIGALPRLLARLPKTAQAPVLIARLTEPYSTASATRTAVALALARAHWMADDPARALNQVQSVQRQDPAAPGTALLALELMAKLPQAESLATTYLARPDTEPAVRMAYVRVLMQAQRYAEAGAQLERVTTERPDVPDAWLMLGALRLEMRQAATAEIALLRYLHLAQGMAAPAAASQGGAVEPTDAGEDSDENNDPGGEINRASGITQAHLLLATAAEQRGDMPAAESWLAKVDNPQRALEVQGRRATLMAKQGQVAQARALIQAVPERTGDDRRGKLLAEALVLREVKLWSEAAAVLDRALEQQPEDLVVIYELAMVEEKRGQFDRMESLLRQLIKLKPDHAHAHNALGYSLADRGVKLPDALALITQALVLSPGDPFITDSLGWVEFKMGRLQDAIASLRKAYNTRPDTEIAAHLGEVLWVAGQRDEALRIWREGRLRDADNEVMKETLLRLKVSL